MLCALCQVGTFNSIVGKSGTRLGDKWEDGISTFLGVHTKGFPNCFIMGGPQAFGASFNFVSMLEHQVCEPGIKRHPTTRPARRLVCTVPIG